MQVRNIKVASEAQDLKTSVAGVSDPVVDRARGECAHYTTSVNVKCVDEAKKREREKEQALCGN